MLSTLILLQYNNYYQRYIKTEETLSDYLDSEVYRQTNCNFNPGDGINTTHVFNQATDDADYLLVLDETNNINSRWFIIESVRNLKGQYTVTLHRDVVADYKDKILDAQCFVEKGIVNDNDVAIFNNENVEFNQIKTGETLLKDNTDCQWIVGYYARYTNDDNGNKVVTTIKGETVNSANQIVANRVAGIANWEYYKYITNNFICTPETISYYNIMRNTSSTEWYNTSIVNLYPTKDDTYNGYLQYTDSRQASYAYKTKEQITKTAPTKFKYYTNEFHTKSKTIIDWHNEEETAKFLALANSNILDTNTNILYNITLTRQDNDIFASRFTRADIPLNSSLDQQLLQAFSDADIIATSATRPAAQLVVQSDLYKLTLTAIPNYTASYNIGQGRLFTVDAPYDIFAIPYSDTFKFTGNGTTITTSKTIALGVANDIATLIPSNTVYDIQLLPYCPFDTSSYLKGQYTSNDNKEYSWITDKDKNKVGVIFNISKSDITFNIPLEITVKDVKMDNATKFCRLVSPNYNGQFEFTPAKNNGVSYINVDMTVKPYSPYIHLNPNFGRLYGSDYNDARGLICGGDFSLPVVSDAWKNYQITNKNYQDIFNRQIENMEFNNSIARIQDRINAVTGTIAGGGAGAFAGSAFGSVGAIAGAAVGTVASAVGGIADITLNEKLRNETLDYTKDLFGMNMSNIKALPNSLTRVSSFNYNNKGFPFIEYYDCTDEEKLAFANKIKFNGMTVNRIGKLKDYLNTWYYPAGNASQALVSVYHPYIKGKLIRFDDQLDYIENPLYGDYHLWQAIADEINKGVYILA